MNWVDAKKLFSTTRNGVNLHLQWHSKSTNLQLFTTKFYILHTFFFQIYIYNDPQNLQIYNTKMMIFYILQSFFGQNLQSTFTLRPPPFILTEMDQNE